MPTLNTGRLDHTNVNRSVLLESVTSLSEILNLEPEKYAQYTARHTRLSKDGPHLPLNNRAATAICAGLVKLLTKKPIPAAELPGFDFEYFAYCFSIVWNASSAEERTKYEGRLIMGLQNEDSFSHLYFELQIALVYLTYGCTVTLRNPPKGELGYDLDVSKCGITFCVEVKTVSSATGMPIEQAWLNQAMTKLGNALGPKLDPWPAFRVDVRYLGTTRPSHPELMKAFDEVGNLLQVACPEVRTALLHARLSSLAPTEIQGFYAGYEATEPTVIAFGGSSRLGVVLATTQKRWKLEDAVSDVMEDAAKRQLPPNQHSALWIQIVGLTAMSSTPGELINEFLNDKPLLWKQLNKRQDREMGAPGLIGVHVTGDAQLWQQDDGRISIQLPHVFMTNSQFTEDAHMYRFLSMDKRESKHMVSPRGAENHYKWPRAK